MTSPLVFSYIVSNIVDDITISILNIDSNKEKGRISQPVFQENKARQFFRKTNLSYPWYAHVRVPFCLITKDIMKYIFDVSWIQNSEENKIC